MNKTINNLWNRLEGGCTAVLSFDELLPATFAADMQELFGINPDTDIVSGAGFGYDEGYCNTAVIAVLKDGAAIDQVKDRLETYAEERKVPESYLLYRDENGNCATECLEPGFGFSKPDYVNLMTESGFVVDEYNVCFFEGTVPGFNKKVDTANA